MARRSGSLMTNVLLFLLSASVIATIGTIFYHLIDTSYETQTALLSTEDQSRFFDGIYIRDERVLTYDGTGVVNYLLEDGGKAAAGDIVAEIYPTADDISRKKRCEQMQAKLTALQAISNPGTLEQAQPTDLARQIRRSYCALVADMDDWRLDALDSRTEAFVNTLSTYQIVISQGQTNFDEQIAALTASVEQEKANLTTPVARLKSESSAYFISYADGFEGILTTENLPVVTPDAIRQILTGEYVPDVPENAVGKTVTGYGWYLVGMIDNHDQLFRQGETATIRLPGTQTQARVTIQELRSVDAYGNPIPEGTADESGQVAAGQQLVVLYGEAMKRDFVRNRIENVELVSGSYEGLKVPREAIRFKDMEVEVTDEQTGETTKEMQNCRGVYVEDADHVVFKRIDVIYDGSDYVLSRANAGADFLMLYDAIIVEGIEADGE